MGSPDTGDAAAVYLRHVTALAEQLLTAEDPYEVGLRLWGDSFGLMDPGELSGAMCSVWGALTDWVEIRPAEGDLARAEMVRAAREWLALNPRDRDAVRRYLDHWLYDVCGYERP